MRNEDGQTVWTNLLKFRKAVSFLTDNRSSLVYVFPKKVAYLGGQVESGMVTTEQNKLHWRTYGSQLQNLFWQRFMFFGRVDFMFGQPKSAEYLSGGQVK